MQSQGWKSLAELKELCKWPTDTAQLRSSCRGAALCHVSIHSICDSWCNARLMLAHGQSFAIGPSICMNWLLTYQSRGTGATHVLLPAVSAVIEELLRDWDVILDDPILGICHHYCQARGTCSRESLSLRMFLSRKFESVEDI